MRWIWVLVATPFACTDPGLPLLGPQIGMGNAAYQHQGDTRLGAAPLSVAIVGDIGGGPYRDVIVPLDRGGETELAIFDSGSSGGQSLATIIGGWGDSMWGHYVTTGDHDGDGTIDFATGAPLTPSKRGELYIFYGQGDRYRPGEVRLASDAADRVLLTKPNFNARFTGGPGYGFVGDLDGDERDDVVIGYSGFSPESRLQIVFSSALEGRDVTLDETNSLWLYSEASDAYLGSAFATVGDLNERAGAELLVGAEGYGGNGGAVVVLDPYELWQSGTTEAAVEDIGVTLVGDPEEYAGRSVDGGYDVDGRGKPDLLIAARWRNQASGGAWLVRSEDLVIEPGAKVSLHDVGLSIEPPRRGYFGEQVRFTPDLDGDRRAEILIGAPQDAAVRNRFQVGTGAMYLMLSSRGWPTAHGVWHTSGATLSIVGEPTMSSVGQAFDVAFGADADPLLDIAVAAINEDLELVLSIF